MTTDKTPATLDAVRNLIVCDTQFGWNGETTLKLPELLDLQERGWMIEGDDNSEFELTSAGREVVARALESGAPATLATAKHGGCVQLGDGVKECARRNCKERTGSANADCTGCGGTGYRRECNDLDCADHGCCGYGKCYVSPTDKALSAQPSPGGQGTVAEEIELIRAVLDGYPDSIARSDALRAVRVIGATLAARQPVGEPIGYLIESGSPEIGRYFHEYPTTRAERCRPIYDGNGVLCAAPPVQQLAQAVDDRFPNGLSDAIEYANEMEEAASALYEKVFGHEDDGEDCGTVVMRRVLHHLTEQPAQAVDLGKIIEQIAQQWDGCNYDAVGETIDVGRAIRAAGKRLIDSQAEVRRG